MLIYSDNTGGMNGSFDPSKCNAVKCYLEHFGNSLYLSFMLANGTFKEKHEASLELPICERKMEYWQRQSNFIESEADRGRKNLREQWAT